MMFAVFAGSSQLVAQSGTGSVSGVVRDASGAVVPGTAVELTNQDTGAMREASTDGQGTFRFEALSAGAYRLRFTRDGFTSTARVLSLAAENRVLNIQLEISGVSTTVNVSDTGGTLLDLAGRSTASKLDIPDKELPVQVSSIPLDLLQAQGVNTVAEAIRNASGVSGRRLWGMYEYYTIRGFSVGDRGTDVQLVDGMRLEGNRIATQLNNVEQVDVLKGPNSLLYGGQTLGGAINIIRKKPQATPAYELLYKGGSFNTHQVGGGATGLVFGLDQLLYRTDVSYENTSGWRDAGSRRLNISPVLTWLIGEKVRVSVHESFNRDQFDGDAGIPLGVLNIQGFDLSRRFNTPQDFAHIYDSQSQILLSVELSPRVRFRNSLFSRWTNDQYFTAEGLTYVPALNQVNREFLYFKHHRRPVLNQSELFGRFSIAGTSHAFLLGYEYEDFFNITDRSASRSVATTPMNLSTFAETHQFVSGFPLSRRDHFANRTNSFYWQDQIGITHWLKLNVGGRLDDYLRTAHNDPWNGLQMVSRGPEVRRTQRPYTYRAGVVVEPNEQQQFYFSSATAFRPVEQVPVDGRQLEPETGRSYEIGHRWQGIGGHLTLSTALYRIIRKNIVISLPGQLFDQAGQQSSKGVDIDIKGSLGRGVSLLANYGYSLPRFDDYRELNGTLDLSGRRPRFTQRHASNVWLSKAWRAGVTTGLGMRYLSSVYTDNRQTIRLGGWTTFSGSVGMHRKKYDLMLNAENLFNRQRYFVSEINGNQIYPGEPINVFATVRLRIP